MFLRNLKFTFTVSGSIASGQTALLVYLTTA
jgi:Ni2+-binding GTPase involved in maturation of urease and hydrogenase